jgi:hypothetical protein
VDFNTECDAEHVWIVRSLYTNTNGPNSVVGKAIGYELDGPWIESRGGEIFRLVQTGPGAHSASCRMGTGSFPAVNSGRGVTLTPHPLLVPWSRKGRAIPLFPPPPHEPYGLYRVSVPVQRCTLPYCIQTQILDENYACVDFSSITYAENAVPIIRDDRRMRKTRRRCIFYSEHELTLWRTVLPHRSPSSQEMPHHVPQGKLNYSVLKKSPLRVFPTLSHFNPVLTHKQRL